MEHAVYLCGWKTSRKGIRLWTTAAPRLSVEAGSYDEAEELLLDAILNAGGAAQAVLEFVPPLPKSAILAKYCSPELLLVCGDDRFQTDFPDPDPVTGDESFEERMRWADTFYDRPLCRNCGASPGLRTERPLPMRYLPGRYDGAFGHIGRDAGPTIEIVSAAFLALLTPAERDALELRPVLRTRRGKKEFFELLGPAGPPMVAVAGLSLNGGWRCTAYGRGYWGYWSRSFELNDFLARSDLPAPLPGVFIVSRGPEIHLGMTAARWSELVGRPGTRGFASRRVGVVDDHKVIREPNLPPYVGLRGTYAIERERP